MPHDAQPFNVCAEMMSGWQDSFMLMLVLQPVGDHTISHRLGIEDFTVKVFMKSVDDRSEIDRRLLGDLSTTDHRLLHVQNLCN